MRAYLLLAVFALVAVCVSAQKPQAPITLANFGCPPGQYVTGSVPNQKCEPCIAGYYKDTFGAESCKRCPDGQSTNKQTGLSICIDCVPGKYARSTTGEYLYPECSSCEAGKYQPQSAQRDCLACREGYWCSAIGAIQREPCLPGTFSSNSRSVYTVCDDCVPGTFTPTTALSVCGNCDQGDWSPRKSDACWPCDAGTFNRAKGSSACIQCEYGQFAAQEGSEKCDKCPAGRYQGNVASKECLPCPTGTHSAEGAGVCSPDGIVKTTETGQSYTTITPPPPGPKVVLLESDAETEAEDELDAESDLDTEDEFIEMEDKPKARKGAPQKKKGRVNRPPPHPAPIIPAKYGKFHHVDSKVKFGKLAQAHAQAAAMHAKEAARYQAKDERKKANKKKDAAKKF